VIFAGLFLNKLALKNGSACTNIKQFAGHTVATTADTLGKSMVHLS
jgi:hypothetical protein